MNNLLEITNERFNLNCTEAEFEAHYNNYIVTGVIDCEVSIDEAKEPEVGIMRNSYRLDSFTLSYILIERTFDKVELNEFCGDKITLNEKEMDILNNDIESHFNKLVQDFEN